MSDIGLPAGLGAFVLAGGLGVLFLLATLVSLAVVGAGASQTKTPLTRHKAFPHLRGLLLCLLGYGIVALMALGNDWSLRAINQWLDANPLLWAGAILALWPASVLLGKRRGQA